MLVKDLVVKDEVSVDIKKDVLDALFLMFSNRRRVVPVLDNSRFVGTISIAAYAKILRELSERKPESICVSEVMDAGAATVSPNTELRYVLDMLCNKGVYGVPVISGHEFIAMVKREDILKKFIPLLKGKLTVMDVMSYYVSTNSVHDPLENIANKILSGTERRIVIMDYNTLQGTVDILDLANVLLTEGVDLTAMTVKDILSPNTVTVSKYDDATKAGSIMLEWGIWGVAVVDRELEGIVKDKDILQRIYAII